MRTSSSNKNSKLINFSGASDPYVKIKSCGRLLHKTRTVHRDLNPTWDESVTLPIEDPFQTINFKVNYTVKF